MKISLFYGILTFMMIDSDSYEIYLVLVLCSALHPLSVFPIPLQFFTSLPPLALGLFDQDVSYQRRLLKPHLYWASQENSAYNTKVRGQHGTVLHCNIYRYMYECTHLHIHVHVCYLILLYNIMEIFQGRKLFF